MKKSLLSLVFILSGLYISAQQEKSVTDYIKKYRDLALQEMHLYKIPASITLAQGILETSCGNSELARNANNHFGIKCKEEWTGEKYYYDDDEKHECFRKYRSDTASYRDHSLFLTLRKYYKALFLLDICDYHGWAFGLKKAGYATEPLYAEMLVKIIEDNQLYKYDCPDQQVYRDTLKISYIKANSKTQVTVSDTLKPLGINIKPRFNNEDDFGEITLAGNSRKVYVNNGVKYVKARKRDSFESIANDFSLTTSEIYHFNDLKQGVFLKEGETVYIESKKKKTEKEFHTTSSGETMRSISQIYGIQLKELYTRNHMKNGSEPKSGQKLWLRNSKPEE
jgi:LysM repeat protein